MTTTPQRTKTKPAKDGKRWMLYPDAAAVGDTNDYPVLSVCWSLAEARADVRDTFGYPCAIYWGTVINGWMDDEHFVEVCEPGTPQQTTGART